MFQRHTRQPFPTRNILVLAAAIVGILFYMLQKLREKPQQPAQVIETELAEPRDTGLRPMEAFYAMREFPEFKPDIAAYETALFEARQQAAAARPRGGNEGIFAPWVLQGPGNIGARINTIAIDPTDKNTIYIGYSGGGAWKTTDGGQSWKPIFDNNNFLSVGNIAIDPQNTNIIYLGTGDPNISAYPFIGDGVWKSTDKGETWQPIGLADQRIVSKIVVNPAGQQQLYVATMGLPFERNNQRGLYQKPTNSGAWQQSLFISDQAGIIDLVASPSNPNILYAAAWDRIRSNQESLVTGVNARIWKTTDGGQNWTPLGGGLPTGNQCRIGLAIDPANDQHIVASYCGTNLDFLGLFESFNGGQSWTQNPCNGLDYGFQGGFAWYFAQVRINPYNAQDMWLLGVTTYRSTDGGQNWYQAVGWNGVHVDHHDVAFLSATEFLIGTDGGLYRSNDNGNNWFRADEIPTTQFYRTAYNPHQPNWYYGGAQDNGTVAGNKNIINDWQHLFGGDGFQAVFHPTNPNIYYYEYQNGAINGTTDNGGFFESATDGIDGSDRRHWDMQYIMSRHDADIMYTGTYRLYQGFGHMPSWSPITDDLTDGIIYGARFHTISTLDESPIDPDHVYVGTTDGNVWFVNVSTQDANNISQGLPDRYVSSVKASTADPNRIFVSHTGYRNNDFTARIHRSDNQGVTWTPVSSDLPNLAVNDLHILPGHQDSVIFAATDGGVYVTLNGGQHWDRLGSGMPFVPVYDLDMNLSEKTLIAGTHARSIMSFPLDSLRIGENSSTFSPGGIAAPLLQIAPSLASNQTTLTIDHLTSKQNAEVVITDMAGKTIWQQQFKGFGKHQETIDLQTFPPGIYLAYAKSNGKIWGTRKFVIAR